MSRIYNEIKTIAINSPDKTALFLPYEKDEFRNISYKELVLEVDKIINLLKEKKFKNIAMLLDNSKEWIFFDLACMELQIALTPIPQFFSQEQILNLIKNAAIEYIITDEQDRFGFLEYSKIENLFNPNISLLKISNPEKNVVESNVTKITFTSGTSSEAKGVALTNDNIEKVVFSLIKRTGEENAVNNLILFPLAILLENIAGVYCSLCVGAKVTLLPLKFTGINISGNFNPEYFVYAIEKLGATSFIITPELLKVLVYLFKLKKITLSQAKFIAIGGAVVSEDLLVEAANLGIPVYQGYGLSEFASVVSLNSIKENKIGSVGKILPHIEIKIAEDGEILLKGNKADYVGNKAEEDWYQSGDLGYLDDAGYLFITGRKKNVIITSMGRNFSPEWVESKLLENPLISQAVIFGEASKFNIAIITPSQTEYDSNLIQKIIDNANNNLPQYARIEDYIIADQRFDLANKMLTANGRIRREEIYKNYAQKIKNLINKKL